MTLETLTHTPADFQIVYDAAVRDITLRLLESNAHDRTEEDFYIVGIVLYHFCCGETIEVNMFLAAGSEVWQQIEDAQEQWELGTPDDEEAQTLATSLVTTTLHFFHPTLVLPLAQENTVQTNG